MKKIYLALSFVLLLISEHVYAMDMENNLFAEINHSNLMVNNFNFNTDDLKRS